MNERRAQDLRQQNTTYKQQRACYNKRRYPSKKNASAIARLMGAGLNAYCCPLCRSWHIGHSTTLRAKRAQEPTALHMKGD